MLILCGLPLVECVLSGCTRWAWKRCIYTAGHDSETSGLATVEEFEWLWNQPDWLILKKTYEDTQGRAPPDILYLDHDNADIVLAIRGINLAKESDYAVLLDNRLGKRKFDGGYVHNGLLKAAGWVMDAECDILRELVEGYSNYSLTFTGHSLGSGLAAMLSMVVVQNRDKLGHIERKRIRCYAIAPARCMSLNLAVRYADKSTALFLDQDDFLPSTATPLEDIFKSLFCRLPCLLCLRCMKDTCILEEKKLKDPRRLYAPGGLYHLVERKPFRMGRFPPVIRTTVPVDGRFEHIVRSCNATSDHAIIWIEKEAQRALDTKKFLMKEKDGTLEIPAKQILERQETLARHMDETWDETIERLFDKDEHDHIVLKK
ncbi:hypothetical protein Fmac_023604 [Flemingia macrophylla]|uniref:Uncharacterized protein n=1 Tax=Flemingia macrophylla TaxID=520843 RepID=A0ABD1LM50_9FABA